MAASSSSTSVTLTAVADVQRLLDEAVGERDSLAAQLREVQAAASAAEGARERAAAEAERERGERLGLQQQLEALREGLDERSASAAAADARVPGLQVGVVHPLVVLRWLVAGMGCRGTHCIAWQCEWTYMRSRLSQNLGCFCMAGRGGVSNRNLTVACLQLAWL